MTGLIRPEARAFLLRWRDVLIALAALGAGLWLALAKHGLFALVGWALVILAVAFLWTSVQRKRFAAAGQAPGVVQIVEAEIRYFGPLGGGMLGLDALTRVGLSADGALWLIQGEDGSTFAIPRAAEGAEALFDAFCALPGFDMEHALRALRSSSAKPSPKAPGHFGQGQILWQRRARQALT